MEDTSDSYTKFLHPSRKMLLLIFVIVLASIVVSNIITLWLERTFDLHIPSLGTIKTLGIEAYWDRNLEKKTETIDWGTIWTGSSKSVSFYVKSISNVKATLYLNTTNWNPANISEYLSLSWNYQRITVRPGEVIKVTLTLSASSSRSFTHYLVTNDVTAFSFDIIIGTSENSS